MPRAPKASRAYTKAILSFGLVNIPLEVWSGTDNKHGIHRHQYVEGTDHSIRYLKVDAETGEPADKIEARVETEYGDVFVSDAEVERLFTLSPYSMAVKGFYPRNLLVTGSFVPKSLYYVTPGRSEGKGKKKVVLESTNRALTTLLTAMKNKHAMALVEMVVRGAPKPCLLLPDGTLWEVYYEEHLRERPTYQDVELRSAEVAMAEGLVDVLMEADPPVLSDERTLLIQDFADKKARAGDFAKPEEEEVAEPVAEEATGFDTALQAQIEAIKAAKAAKGA